MADGKVHLKLIDIIYGTSSLNMTPEACSEQAHRIAHAILDKFDVSLKAPVTSGEGNSK